MFKKSLAYLLLTIIFLSCQEKTLENKFYQKSFNRWSAGTKVSWINPHFLDIEKITEPENTVQAVLEVEFIDKSFSKVSDCLIYSIPTKGEAGHLYFVENPKRVKCEQLLQSEKIAEIKNIVNFGFEQNESNLILKIDEKRFSYDFANYVDLKDFKILSSSERMISLITASVDYKLKENVLNIGDTCFEVDDECNIIKNNICDRCIGGHYQIINNKCPSLQTKICGINNCGLKNQVACLRGYTASGVSPENYCINGSPVGFCNKGLNTVCENGVLICE